MSADGNGNLSVSTSVQRLIFVPSLGHQVDCADPAAPCVFGAASVSPGAPVSLSQPLQFAPVPPLLQLANRSVTEGDVGTTSLSLPVTLSYASTQNVTVQFATVASGTDCAFAVADPATDYTPTNGTLTFAPGETNKTVTINVNGDTLIEPDECIEASFTNPTNATLSPSNGLAFGTIVNDDPVTINLDFGSVVEGDAGTTALNIPVTLSRVSTQTITVQFATVASGTDCTLAVADPTTDYTPTNGTLTFAPGETNKTVTINVNGDTLIEPDECIEASFTNPTNATLSPSNGLAFGTIVNDDPVTIRPGAGSIVEGDSGTTALHIPITLSRPYPVAVSAQWTTFVNPGNPPCQADPASDYTPTSGTVNFAPGATTETATVSINGDTLVEPDECVLITLQNPTNAKIGGFYGIGVGTITNDD